MVASAGWGKRSLISYHFTELVLKIMEMRMLAFLFFSFPFLRNYAKILFKEKGPKSPYPFQYS
jgi:hypothetical protein